MQCSTDKPGPKSKGEQLSLLPEYDEADAATMAPTPIAAAVAQSIHSRRYKEGANPAQPLLLPPSVEDYITGDNPVRAIKAYVDTLDCGALKFKNSGGDLKAGQPAFDPADLLELYLYGYLNRVRSSRRLAAECVRNLEVIWLLNGLRPGYHTIADFRKDNAEALKAVNNDFVQLCHELGLFGGKLVGIDGSFFNGSASDGSIKTKKQLQTELAAIERDIERYQQEINSNDADENNVPDDADACAEQLAAIEAHAQQIPKASEVTPIEPAADDGEAPVILAEPGHDPVCDNHKTTEISSSKEAAAPQEVQQACTVAEQENRDGIPAPNGDADPVYPPVHDSNDTAEVSAANSVDATDEKLAALKASAEHKTSQIAQLEKSGETQISLTDSDARRLVKQGKKVTGYNVQTVIDGMHKLILTHEVTNAGNDFGQLIPMVKKAKDALAEAVARSLGPSQPTPLEQALTVLADAGYYTEADIAACEAESVIVYVPIPNKHRAVKAGGRLPGSEFHYDASQDAYVCPSGQTLVAIGKPHEKNGSLRQCYQSKTSQCAGCPQRAQCLPKKAPRRTIYRSEHADAADRHRKHMAAEDSAGKMRERAALCEHPFGTMKRWLGWDHFLVRGFKKVRGEMALLVNCYNLRRVMTILGVCGFIAYCEARKLRLEAERNSVTLFALFSALFRRPQRLIRHFFHTADLSSAHNPPGQETALRPLRAAGDQFSPAWCSD